MSPEPGRVGEGIFNLQDELAAKEAIRTGLDIITSAAERNHPGLNILITGLFIDCQETRCIHPAVKYVIRNHNVWVVLGGVGFGTEYPISIPPEAPNALILSINWGGKAGRICYEGYEENNYNSGCFRLLDQPGTPKYLPLSPGKLNADSLSEYLMGDTVLSSVRKDLSEMFLQAIYNAGGKLPSGMPKEPSIDKPFDQMSIEELVDYKCTLTGSDSI